MAVSFQTQYFAGRNDDGNQYTATYKTALPGGINANFSQAVDTNFRIRFEVYNTGTSSGTCTPQLQYSLNGSIWYDVNGSSNVVRSSASTRFTDGTSTTNQLALPAGMYRAGYMDDVDGTTSGVVLYSQDDATEFEFCVQIRSADVSNNDTIQLQVTGVSFTVPSFGATPTITVVAPHSVRYQTGTARISTTTQRAQQGTAKLVLRAQQSQQGCSKLVLRNASSQSAVSRIQVTKLQTLGGVSQIRCLRTFDLAGSSSVILPTQLPGTSRIRVTAPLRNQSAVSSIRNTTRNVLSGTTTIFNHNPALLGTARIRQTGVQASMSGTAAIQGVVRYVGAGSTGAHDGTVTPGLPQGWLPNDIFICYIAAATTSNITMLPGSGAWTALDSGTNNTYVEAGVDTPLRSTCYWKRAQAGDTAPSVLGSGYTVAQIVAYRNASLVDVIDATSTPRSSIGVVAPGDLTTQHDNVLVVMVGCAIYTGVNGLSGTFTTASGSPVPIKRLDTPYTANYPEIVVADFAVPTKNTVVTHETITCSKSSNYTLGQLIALRPQTSVPRNQLGRAAIQNTTARVASGVARLQSTAVPKIATGRAFVVNRRLQQNTGKTAVQNTTLQNSQARSRIEITAAGKSILSNSRLQGTSLAFQVGHSAILRRTTRYTTSVSRVQNNRYHSLGGTTHLLIQYTTVREAFGHAAVQNTTQQTSGGVSRIRRNANQPSLNSTCRVQKTGVVQLQQANTRIKQIVLRGLQGKTAIYGTTTRTNAGKLRVQNRFSQQLGGTTHLLRQYTTSRQAQGLSRLQNAARKGLGGTTAVQNSTQKIVLGTCQIRKTAPLVTRFGAARIGNAGLLYRLSGKARLQVTVPKQLGGTAHILGMKYLSGSALIVRENIIGIQAASRIQVSNLKSLTSISRLQAKTTQQTQGTAQMRNTAPLVSLAGTARIAHLRYPVLPGLSRLQATSVQNLASVARLKRINVQSLQTGQSRLSNTAHVSLGSISRVQVSTIQQALGRSLLLNRHVLTTEGRGRIQITSLARLSGSSSLRNTTIRHHYGDACIKQSRFTPFLYGTARIEKPLFSRARLLVLEPQNRVIKPTRVTQTLNNGMNISLFGPNKPLLKHSTSQIDVTVDCTDYLAETKDNDAIATATWTVPSGLVKVSESNTTSLATVWIAKGINGKVYPMILTLTTTKGRIETVKVEIQVKDN